MKICVSSMLLAAVAFTASSASGAVTYVSSTRSVSAQVFPGTPPPAINSNAFGVFNESISHNINDPFGGPGSASMSASQNSNYLTDRIAYNLSASAFDGISASSGSGQGSSSSLLQVRFTLTEATPYAILGTPGTTGGTAFATASERLVLVGPGTVIFLQTNIGGGLANLTGVLAAGTYDYTVQLNASSNATGTSFSNVSVNRELAIPAPAAAGVMALGGLLAARRRRA